jgi:hypothetical protein
VSTKEKGPKVAEQIVASMTRRFEQYQQLDLRPVPFHYNCILLSYLECDDPDRALHALKLMLEHPDDLDVSSYIHLLRMCPSSPDLGSKVAVRMWQEFLEGETNNDNDDNISKNVVDNEEEDGSTIGAGSSTSTSTSSSRRRLTNTTLPDFPSVFYAHFLQAIRPLPVGKLRTIYFDECFSRAIHFGKVNQYILKEFLLHHKSDELFTKHLGPYRRHIYGMKADTALRRLVSLIPTEWCQHADQKTTRQQ